MKAHSRIFLMVITAFSLAVLALVGASADGVPSQASASTNVTLIPEGGQAFTMGAQAPSGNVVLGSLPEPNLSITCTRLSDFSFEADVSVHPAMIYYGYYVEYHFTGSYPTDRQLNKFHIVHTFTDVTAVLYPLTVVVKILSTPSQMIPDAMGSAVIDCSYFCRGEGTLPDKLCFKGEVDGQCCYDQ